MSRCVLCLLKTDATRLFGTRPENEPVDLPGWLGGVLFGFIAGLTVEANEDLCQACWAVVLRGAGRPKVDQ